jgi:hypothetical protein
MVNNFKWRELSCLPLAYKNHVLSTTFAQQQSHEDFCETLLYFVFHYWSFPLLKGKVKFHLKFFSFQKLIRLIFNSFIFLHKQVKIIVTISTTGIKSILLLSDFKFISSKMCSTRKICYTLLKLLNLSPS